MKALDNAKAIYDLTMNERCEEKVQVLFSNGLHKLIIDLIEELEDLENRSCSNCKHSLNLHNTKNIINSELVCKIDSRYNNKDFCCNRWQNKQ